MQLQSTLFLASLGKYPLVSFFSIIYLLPAPRSLRSTTFEHGVRINLICPYFIDTPIIPTGARLILAGGGTGKPEDVVDAGTRLMADTRIIGRALAIGPKVTVSDDGQLITTKFKNGGNEKAVWECYAEDFEEVGTSHFGHNHYNPRCTNKHIEAFAARFIKLINAVETARGFGGFLYDVFLAFAYPIRRMIGS